MYFGDIDYMIIWMCLCCVFQTCELCPNSGGIFKETDAGRCVHQTWITCCMFYHLIIVFVWAKDAESDVSKPIRANTGQGHFISEGYWVKIVKMCLGVFMYRGSNVLIHRYDTRLPNKCFFFLHWFNKRIPHLHQLIMLIFNN